MPTQKDILDMGNAVGELSTHEKILLDIASKKYCRESDPSGSKCNLFVNDMLSKYYGIELPKRKMIATEGFRKRTSEGWFEGFDDYPASAAVQGTFFDNAARLPNTGVYNISAIEGSKLSSKGKPVIVLGDGHATLASPHDKWPQVYRSDLSNRYDERMEVGLKYPNNLKFYNIDIDQYKKFMSIMKDFKIEDVIYDFNKGSNKLREMLGK